MSAAKQNPDHARSLAVTVARKTSAFNREIFINRLIG